MHKQVHFKLVWENDAKWDHIMQRVGGRRNVLHPVGTELSHACISQSKKREEQQQQKWERGMNSMFTKVTKPRLLFYTLTWLKGGGSDQDK